MPNPRKPTAVKALIDAALVRLQLKRMGVHQPDPAQLPNPSGTRKKKR